MQGYDVQQSTTTYPLVFLMVLSSDHITGATGLSPTVTISKNGGAFASPSGAVTEIGSGWYKVAGNATDTATLGPIILHASVATADPTDAVYPVVAYNPQSATNLGLTNLDAAVSSRSTYAGGAVASVTAAITLPSIPSNWITAAGINAGALNGKGDWLLASSYTAPFTLTTTLGAARAMDGVADTARTINDAFQCAIDSVCAQVDASSGTQIVYKTASTGTTLRTKTLTLITPPTTVPDKAV